MNEGSLFKRTLVVTGALVGISAAWITLVSVVLVTLVGRATSPSSVAEETAARVTDDAPHATKTGVGAQAGATAAPTHARATTSKPNG